MSDFFNSPKCTRLTYMCVCVLCMRMYEYICIYVCVYVCMYVYLLQHEGQEGGQPVVAQIQHLKDIYRVGEGG
jgi:hypothetical protein